MFLRKSGRDPLGLSSYQNESRNHICLTPVCFASYHEFVCLLQHSFIGLHVEQKEVIKGLEQLVYEITLKYVQNALI